MTGKVLVTGDNGYIGSTLSSLLLSQGFSVVGLDTQFFKDSILGDYDSAYTCIKNDTRKIDDLDLHEFDSIIHLAALSNDPMGDINPSLTEEINFRATVHLAAKAKKQGVKRFLFSSSCSIYGIGKDPVVTEVSAINPLTAYAKSKINSEQELMKLADNDFCIGLLRNSTVYGYAPKFRNDLVVNNLVTNGFATKQIKVMSDGSPWRPIIDVRDLSQIFIEFLKIDAGHINGQIFNIGFTENNFQVKDVLHKIQNVLRDCEVVYTGEHGADTRSYKVNFDKFSETFPSVRQQWPLEASIEDLVSQLKKNKFSVSDIQKGTYSRISVLKNLLASKQVDNNLYWI
jgi:nucleoside-diphosphate-sugar epimerase